MSEPNEGRFKATENEAEVEGHMPRAWGGGAEGRAARGREPETGGHIIGSTGAFATPQDASGEGRGEGEVEGHVLGYGKAVPEAEPGGEGDPEVGGHALGLPERPIRR